MSTNGDKDRGNRKTKKRNRICLKKYSSERTN